jgi:uncharacterized phage protein (TIGR02220 family)
LNYYPHHIGDYLRDTAHLTAAEDGIYRRLLDLYYASEKPLPIDTQWVCRLVRAHTDDEREAVGSVLKQFFEKYEDGWHNKRADEEIRKGKRRVKAARTNGKRGGRHKTQWVSEKNPVGSHAANPEPDSQKPKAKAKSQRSKGNVGLKPDAMTVLRFLNEKTGRNYEDCDANLDFITARLREGASVDDCRAVIAKKCREWLTDEEMTIYLRPATLFNRTKFAQYRGEIGAAESPQERIAV